MDTVSHECAVGSCAILVHMAYCSRHTGSVPGLLTGGEYCKLRLVCGIVCGTLYCCLYRRSDVFAHERVPGCRQYPKRAYAAHYSPAAGGNRKVRKRQSAKDCQHLKRRNGNLSCTQAPRQSGSDCYPHRAALSTACFRLAVRAFEPCPRCAWLSHHDENDRKRHGAENGAIPKFTFRYVK